MHSHCMCLTPTSSINQIKQNWMQSGQGGEKKIIMLINNLHFHNEIYMLNISHKLLIRCEKLPSLNFTCKKKITIIFLN
jgi:hypothetical protein